MTILSVVKDVCRTPGIGLDPPAQLMSSTDREYMEMATVADEMATRIMRAYDWQALQVQKTFTGDAATEAFDLPADYDRMPNAASMWSSRWTWAFNKITSTDEWLEYQVVPYTFINGNWIIYGDQFHFLPIMAVAETIKFFYISNLYAKDADNVPKAAFTADTDTFRLDEKLLKLGIIWQWKAGKGLPYEEDMQNYELALNKLMLSDGGARSTLSGNRNRYSRGVKIAFWQTVGGSS
jgi:hypothetical protein